MKSLDITAEIEKDDLSNDLQMMDKKHFTQKKYDYLTKADDLYFPQKIKWKRAIFIIFHNLFAVYCLFTISFSLKLFVFRKYLLVKYLNINHYTLETITYNRVLIYGSRLL